MMSYFRADDLQAFAKQEDEAPHFQALKARFQALHQQVYSQIQLNDLDFHLIVPADQAIGTKSVSVIENNDPLLCVSYLRPKGQAVTIERLMGREEVTTPHTIEARRHPVIEMRLTASRFTLELILSPDAWWDQQNLVGKLSIARHKQDFYMSLRELGPGYCMGFWCGVHLSEMHLVTRQFQHPRIMDEWMSTFQAGSDWWRIGKWYNFDDEKLAEKTIISEMLQQLRLLHSLYQHLLWTSDNNFREFYRSTL